MVPAERIPKLAARVRWLDRYRHLLAVIVGLVATRFRLVELADVLEADWDDFQVLLYGSIIGIGVWIAAEVVFAYLTALWETEYCRLTREKRVPRAIARRRKRKTAA